MHKFQSKSQSGFTLLELLIVIGILGVLSTALVIVLNPAEAIKKARDAQRISDLNTLKRVMGIYAVGTSNPKMTGANNTGCKGTTSVDTSYQTASDHIYYSYPSDTGAITATQLDGVTFSAGGVVQVTKENLGKVDSTGWLPIDFTTLSGGSPISALPVDPVNTISDLSKPTLTDLVYRYVCSEKTLMYEIDAVFESEAFTITDLKMAKDGGNNDSYYEVGTNLDLFKMESPLVAGTYTIIGHDHLPYKTVIGEDGKEWLDRNLGATRVANAYNDTQAYGDLYQWGRYLDGHQIRTSAVVAGPVSSDTPGSSFLTVINANPWDWRVPQNNTLWQGVGGINNPCPSGFRLPTTTELQTLAAAIPNFTTATCGGSTTCRDVAFNSKLKFPSAGNRDLSSASLVNLGSLGFYWSSSPNGVNASNLLFNSSAVYPADTNSRALAFSVRCIKD